jgi:hypothetical protein
MSIDAYMMLMLMLMLMLMHEPHTSQCRNVAQQPMTIHHHLKTSTPKSNPHNLHSRTNHQPPIASGQPAALHLQPEGIDNLGSAWSLFSSRVESIFDRWEKRKEKEYDRFIFAKDGGPRNS